MGTKAIISLILSVGIPLMTLGIGYSMLTGIPDSVPSEMTVGSQQGASSFDAKLYGFPAQVKQAKEQGRNGEMSIIFTEWEVNSKLKEWVDKGDRSNWPMEVNWARAAFRNTKAVGALNGDMMGLDMTAAVTPSVIIQDGYLRIRSKKIEIGNIPMSAAIGATLQPFIDNELMKLDSEIPKYIPLIISRVTFESQQVVISGMPR